MSYRYVNTRTGERSTIMKEDNLRPLLQEQASIIAELLPKYGELPCKEFRKTNTKQVSSSYIHVVPILPSHI